MEVDKLSSCFQILVCGKLDLTKRTYFDLQCVHIPFLNALEWDATSDNETITL